MSISSFFIWFAFIGLILGQLFGAGDFGTASFTGKIRVVKFIDISCSDPNIGESTSECEIKGVKGAKYKVAFSKTATSSDGSSMNVDSLEKLYPNDVVLSANVNSSGSAASYNMSVSVDYLNI